MNISLETIVIIIDIMIFSIYVAYTLILFGIPVNLSITYYKFERKKKGTGILFPLLMLLLCGSAIPIWIAITPKGISEMFVCFPTITLISLLGVAGSARYKSRHNLIYFHYTCAIIAAICAVSWIFIVAYKIVYIGLTILFTLLYAGMRTKTLRKCTLFWLETAAFYSILFTMLAIKIIPLQL